MARRITTPAIDETGNTYGRWTVLHRIVETGNREARWWCRCECGKEGPVAGKSLRMGISTGCRSCASGRRTHGLSYTPEYRIWSAMVQRCTNPRSKLYPWYGGSGITVCERWRTSFENFIADMGRRPGPEYSIHRTERHYEPGKVIWALLDVQARYKRNSVYVDAIDVRNLLTALENGELIVWADVERYLRPDAA